MLLFLFALPFFCYAQNFDIGLLRSINHNENNFKDAFYHAVAKSVCIINSAVHVWMHVAGLIINDSKLKEGAVYLAGTYLFSAVVTHILKRVVKRDLKIIRN